MSEPKNISPLLDGFTLGAPFSEHHGVVCCPAIKENSNKKYIIKMISVPATQAHFDAMLLAGAYKDPGDAMEYFRGNGEAILKEAELLKNLSRIEGFLPYDGWQMEPITRRRLGYEVYLVGSYKRSLDKYIRKNAFTHLEAINLGLDLCSALTVCRQSGYIYADLKPSNIYVSENKEYRIGDLGFLPMDALRYSSLPERFFSPYTPPELRDPMMPVNLTVDTYGVGMILYQLYNDGQLPFTGTVPPETLADPCHADYELAEIIRKAIHPDPEQRWTDPKDLGKAIAAYMQRNVVNDIPITPFIPLDVSPEDIVVINDRDEDLPEVPQEDPASQPEHPAPEPEPVADMEPLPSDNSEDQTEVQEETGDESLQNEELPTEASSSQDNPEGSEEETEPEEHASVPTEPVAESAPNTEPSYQELTEEVSRILCKANEIIAHEIPEDTAFPAEEQEDPFAFIAEESVDTVDAMYAETSVDEVIDDIPVPKKKKTRHFADTTRKQKSRKFFGRCFLLLILSAGLAGGFWFYQNIYLQAIDALTVNCTQTQMTVLVDTSVEESLLTVHCIDANGNWKTESLRGGKATFSDLKPSTQYTVQVDISGFHKLTGEPVKNFTTDAATRIQEFHAIAGPEHGSVKLDFTIDGNDPDFWNIRYSTEGEEERLETVTGHTAMITGLTVGKVYTFTLDGGKNFDLGGKTSITYLASRLILAENIIITASDENTITVKWSAPGDVVVENWTVRFYDGYGFEEQVTVTENQVQFTDIDPASHYTVEITAAGMTAPSLVNISANPIQITEFQVSDSKQTKLEISWEYTGTEPKDGWLLHYSIDGSGSQVIPCTKAKAEISPLIPGANYSFILEAADSTTVFNNRISHKTGEADVFSEHHFVQETVSLHLLKTPQEADWHFETIASESFTNTFRIGESASMVLESAEPVYVPSNKVNVLFVFRNAYGNVLPELTAEHTLTWKNIWAKADVKTGELDLPSLPTVPGDYQMELFINGGFVGKFEITMTD